MNANEIKKLFDVEGVYDILLCAENIKYETVLDIGFGKGGASIHFAQSQKKVTALGYDIENYDWPRQEFKNLNINVKEELFEKLDKGNKYDLIFLSHALEHNRNPGLMLDKCYEHLNEEGWLIVIVPPWKEEIVGGHVTNGWNLGQLMYNLLLSNFKIKEGHFISHGYNVAGFVQKNKEVPEELKRLRYDNGDLEITKELWPVDIYQARSGYFKSVNWFDGFKQIEVGTLKTKLENLKNKTESMKKSSDIAYGRIKEKNLSLENKLKELKENKNKTNEAYNKLKERNIYLSEVIKENKSKSDEAYKRLKERNAFLNEVIKELKEKK